MLIDIALFMTAFFLSIPLVTGYFAHSYGRSFWLWFTIGIFLPVLAQVILALLCIRKKEQHKEKKYTELTRYEDEYMKQHIQAVFNSPSGSSFPHQV